MVIMVIGVDGKSKMAVNGEHYLQLFIFYLAFQLFYSGWSIQT
jgi:hypothetical protein